MRSEIKRSAVRLDPLLADHVAAHESGFGCLADNRGTATICLLLDNSVTKSALARDVSVADIEFFWKEEFVFELRGMPHDPEHWRWDTQDKKTNDCVEQMAVPPIYNALIPLRWGRPPLGTIFP